MKKTIYIFGNEDLENDSLPIRILPKLQEKFPDIQFKIMDPNENWNMSEEITIIDTVVGIKKVIVFNDLETFSATPRVSVHDFDALTNLRYLKKLGKIKKIKIIGVPQDIEEIEVIKQISEVL